MSKSTRAGAAFVFIWRTIPAPPQTPLPPWRGRIGQADYTGAAADFTQAVELGRDDTLVYFWRGQANTGLGDHAAAVNDFTAAIDRGYDRPDVYHLRSFANVRLEQLDQARLDCERAQQSAPNDPGLIDAGVTFTWPWVNTIRLWTVTVPLGRRTRRRTGAVNLCCGCRWLGS
jgi:tetratricopeptide (TPR) repeat protein